jgi:NADPH:quinone reductase-like Zn-dependent oxidoreductase
MKAIAYEQFGSADVLRLTDLPKPHIGPDTILVKVVAAALNPVDYKVREGYLQGLLDAHFPVVPGWDIAGIVEQPGLDTPEFSAGDEILAYARGDVVSGGTLAEYVAVPVRTAAHKPAGLSFEQAAALPLAGLTAFQSVRRSGLGRGDAVLIHGAAGGVGSYGTQLAVHAGAKVVGTASPANHDYLRSLGAEPVDYHDDLVGQARALAPDGFDVILDFAGSNSMDTVAQLLKQGGNVTSILDPRAREEFGGQYVWVRPDSQDLAELADLAVQGAVTPEIAQIFDLEQAADAYRSLESTHTRGKIIVRV